jgi:hypothetical protein
MDERITRGISVVFHPLFFPLYTLLFFLNQDIITSFYIPVRSQLVLSGIVFLCTIVLPATSVLLLYKMKLVGTFTLGDRGDRVFPLLVTAVYYYMTYWMLKGFPVSFLFSYYMLGTAFLSVLAMIISLKLKISLHMIQAGGFTGMLCGLSNRLTLDLSLLIIPGIILCGIVGSSRLNDNSHKSSEIYSGFLAGAVVMYFFFSFA